MTEHGNLDLCYALSLAMCGQPLNDCLEFLSSSKREIPASLANKAPSQDQCGLAHTAAAATEALGIKAHRCHYSLIC